MTDFRERGVPESLPREERKRKNLEALVRNYYRVLLSVDENLGRVLDALDKEGLDRNTVVVYTSDNGHFLGEHGLYHKRPMYRLHPRADAGPLPGPREGGACRPHPHGPERGRGADASRAGGRAGSRRPPRPQLRPPARGPGRAVAWTLSSTSSMRYPADLCVRKNRGVRTATHKLIHFYEQPEEWELYDLVSPPPPPPSLLSLSLSPPLSRLRSRRDREPRLAARPIRAIARLEGEPGAATP